MQIRRFNHPLKSGNEVYIFSQMTLLRPRICMTERTLWTIKKGRNTKYYLNVKPAKQDKGA